MEVVLESVKVKEGVGNAHIRRRAAECSQVKVSEVHR